MKKLLTVFTIVSIILSLFGCNDIAKETNGGMTESQATSDTVDTQAVSDSLCDGYPLYVNRCEFDSLDEYTESIARYTPDDEFVFFEDISYIGELSSGYFGHDDKDIAKTDDEFFTNGYTTYTLKNKNCGIYIQRIYKKYYNKYRVNEYFDYDYDKREKIEIEGDSLINHNMPPKNEHGIYDRYAYIMDFEQGEAKYYVQYIYSESDATLVGISIVREISDYCLCFGIGFVESNCFHESLPFAYDMSNEEINKFLSKETAKEAIIKLYESHLSAVEARENGN